jgi:hypothetical protein
MIEVTLGGKTYQEMHVDGSAFAQTFLYPSALTRNRAQRKRTGQPVVEARAFIIRKDGSIPNGPRPSAARSALPVPRSPP